MPLFLIVICTGLLIAACIFIPEVLAKRNQAKWREDAQRRNEAIEREYPFSGIEAAGGCI